MNRVLAAVDGSEASNRSLDTLLGMAREFREPPEVVVLSIRVPMPPVTAMGAVVTADMLDEAYAKAQDETLVDARARLLAAGLSTIEKREIGDPAELILRIAADTDCKLIFMGSRGMGGWGTLLLGSTSNKVLHHARCPVVVTH